MKDPNAKKELNRADILALLLKAGLVTINDDFKSIKLYEERLFISDNDLYNTLYAESNSETFTKVRIRHGDGQNSFEAKSFVLNLNNVDYLILKLYDGWNGRTKEEDVVGYLVLYKRSEFEKQYEKLLELGRLADQCSDNEAASIFYKEAEGIIANAPTKLKTRWSKAFRLMSGD